jgi:HEAT repeat protein
VLIEAVRLAGPAARTAAEALASYRSGEAAVALRQAAASSNAALAQAAIQALVQMSTPEAVGVLVELTAEPAQRPALVAALARIDHAQIDSVARGLAHPEAPVRLAAATALGRLGSPSARRLLEALAELDPDHAVRRAAHTALER